MLENCIITSGRANIPLARKIAEHCGVPYTEINFKNFGDGDWKPKFPETIRGLTVIIVQPTNPIAGKHMGEHLYELLVISDAAMRASAKEVIAVIPYFGGARQDRKDEPRVPITARLNADLITNAGIKKVITLDLHVDQIQGFFNIPVDNLYGSTCFVPIIEQMALPNSAASSADVGGARRSEAYAKYFEIPLIICYKSKVDGIIEKLIPLGDLQGKNIWLLDDIVDSAKTITIAADAMLERGAASVRACCSHGVFSGNSQERIDKSGITAFYVLDTIQFEKKSEKIQILSSAPLFGEAIKEHMTPGGSISKLFFF
ncbi:MAG: ribose-phosphate diphosphokinase [bacterium]